MSVRLTETAIAKAIREAAKTGRRDLIDAACPGLRLRVTPAGTKTWALACRDRQGRMRRFTIGAYPAMGVSKAREAARALHHKVKQEGADPVADRKRERETEKAARAGIGTLAAILDNYGQKAGPASWPVSRKRVDLVFKRLLSRPVAGMTAADLQNEADSYPSKQSAAFAVRCIRPALKWAAQPSRRDVPADLALISTDAKVERRKRVLSRDELVAVLPVLRASGRSYAAAMRFMLFTLCRRQEAGSARWRHVDFTSGTWTIPETKSGEPHVVPLSRQAIDLLRAIRPADAKTDAPIFVTSTGAALGNWDRETRLIHEASGTTGWHRHDLRRTGATMLGEMGELPDIIEAALNHTSIRSPIAATYNRSRYRPQVAVALQRLADKLDEIEAGAAQVVASEIRAGAVSPA